MPHHHPDASTLMAYGAGSLHDALATVVACHVSTCSSCQQVVAEAEQLGGVLVEQQPQCELSDSARADFLTLIDADIATPSNRPGTQPTDTAPADTSGSRTIDMPAPLQPLLGQYLDDLRWRFMAPGLKQFLLPSDSGVLRLLRISPGTSMPIHGHTGSELTLVLRGSYSDELGRFGAGDVADLDPDVEHQPATDTGEDCICLIATDAPLKFSGLVPRLLQPFFQL